MKNTIILEIDSKMDEKIVNSKFNDFGLRLI